MKTVQNLWPLQYLSSSTLKTTLWKSQIEGAYSVSKPINIKGSRVHSRPWFPWNCSSNLKIYNKKTTFFPSSLGRVYVMFEALSMFETLSMFRDSKLMIFIFNNCLQNCLNYKYVHSVGLKSTSTLEYRTYNFTLS